MTESSNLSPLHPSTSSFDNEDDKPDTSSTPYEPSPEVFKKPTRTIAPASDDEDYVDDEEQDNEKENSNDNSSENNYEEERRKKIERNKMLLVNLGLGNGLLPKNNNTTTKKQRRSTGTEEQTEIRRSSRLSSKPKPIYNFNELEKENRKIVGQEKRERKNKKEEERRLKYYSKRTLRKYQEDSDDDDDSDIPVYNENNKRRSSRSRNKVDYAEMEENGLEEDEFEEDAFEQVTVVVEESPKKKKKVSKKSTISSPVCSFSNFIIPDDQAINFTEIGGKLATGAADENITHVITKVYKRTLKLMCGIIRGAYVVSEDWLSDSVEAGYFLDEKPYLIKADGVNLLQARKKALQQPIFSDLKFFLCDDVSSVEILNQLIETGSGTLINDVSEMLDDDYDFENCYVIYENEETKEKYPKLPTEIFRTKEFIFSSAVTQKINDV